MCCTSNPTGLSLCEGCSIKQKLDVSCGLKCVLKISFWFFNLPTLFLVFCQSQTFILLLLSAPVLVPTDPTEKEMNFLLFQSRLQSATPRQMESDRSIAHVSMGCGGCAQQGVKSWLGESYIKMKTPILIPGTWAQLRRFGSYKHSR